MLGLNRCGTERASGVQLNLRAFLNSENENHQRHVLNGPVFVPLCGDIRRGDPLCGNLVLATPGSKLNLWFDVPVFLPITILRVGEKGSPSHHTPNMPRSSVYVFP